MKLTTKELTTIALALSDRIFELKREIKIRKDFNENDEDIEFYENELVEAHALQNKILGVR